jgi:hypothetical protein
VAYGAASVNCETTRAGADGSAMDCTHGGTPLQPRVGWKALACLATCLIGCCVLLPLLHRWTSAKPLAANAALATTQQQGRQQRLLRQQLHQVDHHHQQQQQQSVHSQAGQLVS